VRVDGLGTKLLVAEKLDGTDGLWMARCSVVFLMTTRVRGGLNRMVYSALACT
jgi:hypothetical protein